MQEVIQQAKLRKAVAAKDRAKTSAQSITDLDRSTLSGGKNTFGLIMSASRASCANSVLSKVGTAIERPRASSFASRSLEGLALEAGASGHGGGGAFAAFAKSPEAFAKLIEESVKQAVTEALRTELSAEVAAAVRRELQRQQQQQKAPGPSNGD